MRRCHIAFLAEIEQDRPMIRSRAILKGQRCREVQLGMFGRSAPEWIVDALFAGADGVEYSRLVRASDPSQRKTLALAVLYDRHRFTLVDADKAHEERTTGRQVPGPDPRGRAFTDS